MRQARDVLTAQPANIAAKFTQDRMLGMCHGLDNNMEITRRNNSIDELLGLDPPRGSAISRLAMQCTKTDPVNNPRRNPNGTRDTAKQRLSFTLEAFEQKVQHAVRHWQLKSAEELLWSSLHRGGRQRVAVGSNRSIRYNLGCAFIDMIAAMFERYPGRRFFLMTIIHDGWRTFDRRTEINLADIHRRGYQVLNLIGLPCCAIIEIQAAVNSKATIGRLVLPHIHAIGWTDDRAFDAVTIETMMNERRRLQSLNGAPPVTIVEIDPTLGDVAHASGYLFKGAFEAKDFAPPSEKHPRGLTLSRSTSVQPALLLHFDEILSRIDMSELIFTHGCPEQRKILTNALAKLTSSKIQSGHLKNISLFWEQARLRNGKSLYRPVRILRKPVQIR